MTERFITNKEAATAAKKDGVTGVAYGTHDIVVEINEHRPTIDKATRMRPADRTNKAPFAGERRVTGSFGAWDRIVAAQAPIKK